MKIWHLKTCDTCRKAIKALRAAGHDPVLIDVRADGIAADDLARMAEHLPWEKLLNKKSTTWRGLDDADKAEIDQTKALALIAAHPTLLKRPVIDGPGGMSVGWTADVQAKYAV